jgi:hypothetical protein
MVSALREGCLPVQALPGFEFAPPAPYFSYYDYLIYLTGSTAYFLDYPSIQTR